MDYKFINKSIENALKRKNPVSKSGEASGEELNQGDYEEIIEVYATEDPKVFIKLVLHTDSYGDNEKPVSVSFVQPIQKNVTDYVTL